MEDYVVKENANEKAKGHVRLDMYNNLAEAVSHKENESKSKHAFT